MVAHFPDIVHGWVGPFVLIDLRHPEYIKKVLNSDKCLDRADFYSFPYKTGLLISGGELWKRHRKLLNPAFNTNKLNAFLPTVNEKARKLTEVLRGYVDKDAFNVVRLLSALTLESLLSTSFGLERDFINNPFDRIFAIAKKFVLYKFSIQFRIWFSIFHVREAFNIGNTISNFFNLAMPNTRVKNEFTQYCEDILEEAEHEQNDLYNGGNLNFIDILLKNRDYLTSEEIQDEVSTMILSVSFSFKVKQF